MKRIISVTLILLLLISCFISCGEKNREYDEEEVIAAAKALLEKSATVNEVFYGKGIRYISDTNLANGYYYPADEAHLEELGFSTIAELKALTKEVYTEQLSEIIFNTKLSSLEDDGYVLDVARYYQKTDGDAPRIMVFINSEVQYENEIEYLYDTLTVEGSVGETINIRIDILLTNGEGKTQTINAKLSLLEESNGYRLDSLSFAVFDKNKK